VHVCKDSDDCADDEICFLATDHSPNVAACMKLLPGVDGGNPAARYHKKHDAQ